MKYCFAISLICLSTCLLFNRTSTAQERGTISGTVVDENGATVNKAKVNADPVDNRPMGSLVRYVETDANGQFLIDRLAWGKYKVFAKKEDDGYPDMNWSFYSDDIFQIVAITPSTAVAKLRIQLGPKGAILIGTVSNIVTGAPVNAGFKLIRAASPEKWISTSVAPDYRVLLPPTTDVLLEVSAPGYVTWCYGGPSDISKRSPLRLTSGFEMHLDIRLEPARDPKLHSSKFMVPDGYVGWLQLEYNVKEGPLVPIEGGKKVFKFPASGVLKTSSAGPDRGAEDEYVYYSEADSVHQIPMQYWSGNGMVWGNYEGFKGGVMSLFGFFVGTEEQYKKYQSRSTQPGRIHNP
jgi:hypothetical protein